VAASSSRLHMSSSCVIIFRGAFLYAQRNTAWRPHSPERARRRQGSSASCGPNRLSRTWEGWRCSTHCRRRSSPWQSGWRVKATRRRPGFSPLLAIAPLARADRPLQRARPAPGLSPNSRGCATCHVPPSSAISTKGWDVCERPPYRHSYDGGLQRAENIRHVHGRRRSACRLSVRGRLPARFQATYGNYTCAMAAADADERR